MMRRRLIRFVVLAASASLAAAADQGTEQQRESGRALYDKYCSQCHGAKGDGAGTAALRLKPEPRDFTSGKYKFRTTPSGMLPTDADLRKVIREGLPYTSMPAWPAFSDEEVQKIIDHLKTFSADFANPDKEGHPIEIPEPGASTPESVRKGLEIYGLQGCAACHGEHGRGNGTSAPTLTDDWGKHIRPADLTMRWTFRGGPTRRDIFRTFSTGLNGTPMPSYADSLKVEERWHLVNYIYSLGDGDEPDYSNLLRVHYVEDELDLAKGESLFGAAPRARFPLVGQVMEPGRDFHPPTSSVEVRAVHNGKEIALLVRWSDMRAETTGSSGPDLQVPVEEEQQAPAPAPTAGGDESFWGEEAAPAAGAAEGFWGEEEPAAAPGAESGFADALLLQFPSTPPTGIRKPYFIFGDAQSPVDLWFVDLARGNCRLYTARGSGSIEPPVAAVIEVAASYDDGRWSVMFKRSMRSRSGISFEEGQFAPLAFSVWDGFNRERGNKRALSQWFHLYPEPRERVSAAGPMTRAALGALAVELLLIVLIRKRHAPPERGREGRHAAPVTAGRGASG